MGMGADVDDEAEAVGDPHLTLASGDKKDLCCEGGVCHACDQALLELTDALDEPALVEEEELVVEDQRPENMCRSGIKVRNICYDRRCGSTGQQPGGRNCAALPGGANACCMTRITRPCTGPNMDRCRCVSPGMGMGMGMGKMGMGMGKMGMGR